MIGLSATIQKPVLDTSSSCIIGKVSDVYFDEYCKNAVYVCIKCDDSQEMLLPFEEVQNFSDALVIADCLKLLYFDDADITALRTSFLTMPVYTPTGALRGNIEDILINSAGKVVKINIGNEDISPAGIASIGDVIIYKGAFKSKSKPKPRKITIPRPAEDYPVHILDNSDIQNDSNIRENGISITAESAPAPQLLPLNTKPAPTVDVEIMPTAAVQTAKPAVALGTDKREPVLSNGAFEMLLDGSSAFSYDEDARTPTRVICDYEFLLGRKLGADLCTYTGELIAKQGSEVTDKVVEKARRAGKLVELTLNSIKPERKK